MNTYRYHIREDATGYFEVYVPLLDKWFYGDNNQESLDYAYESLYAHQGDHYFEMEEF